MQPHVTQFAQDAFRRGLEETRRLNHASVRAEHILLGVLQLSAGSASAALDSAGVDRVVLARRLEELLPPGETPRHAGEYPYHPSGAALIRHLFGPPPEGRPVKVTSGRVLLGLLTLKDSSVVEAMSSTDVNVPALASRLDSDPDGSE